MTYADGPVVGEIAGWGQMLGLYFDDAVSIDNRAIGGRTARRFIDEGRLDDLASDLGTGDHLLVQWGTNDGNRTATYEINGQTIPYFLEPATDFKSYLLRYVEVARAAGATMVLVTPPPRNSAYCTGGNGTGGHAQAMRELGADEGLAVADLNRKSVDYLRAICPAPTPENFFLVRPDGSVDGTHFQENGARVLARLVADGVRETGLPVGRFVQ
jgi:lysophospholipase L1-like esterase